MSKTLKTVLAVVVVLILMVGVFFLGQYLVNSNNEKADSKKDKNIVGKDEIKNEEFYKFYREDGKVYVELNNKKEFLMNINDDIGLIYDDNKLYYIEEKEKQQKKDTTEYYYVVNYIEISSKKKYTNLAEIYNKYYGISILDIEGDWIYYSVENHDKFSEENTIIEMIFKYNIKTKKESLVMKQHVKPSVKGLGGLVIGPSAVVHGDSLYVIIDDYINSTRSLYKISDGKQVVLDKGIGYASSYGAISNTMQIVGDKLYYSDDILYSYDLKTGIIKKEFETENIIGRPIIKKDKIVVVTSNNELLIKEKEKTRKIKLKFHKDLYSEISDYYDEPSIAPLYAEFNVKNNLVISCTPLELGNFEINLNDLTADEYTITKNQKDNTSSVNELFEVMR